MSVDLQEPQQSILYECKDIRFEDGIKFALLCDYSSRRIIIRSYNRIYELIEDIIEINISNESQLIIYRIYDEKPTTQELLGLYDILFS